MLRLSTCIRMFILIPALTIFCPAQEKLLTETDDAEAKQAFEMLETIADSISGLKLAENRIYLATNSADLLWEKDEKRARAIFDTVTKEIIASISALADFEQEFNHGGNNPVAVIHQQRREIIERMARRDPEMAIDFMRATRVPTGVNALWGQEAAESELELQLAGMIAIKDPVQALNMARAALGKTISYGLVQVMSQLQGKDPSSAQALHREVVDRLMSEDLTQNNSATNVAWNLLSSYQPPQAKEETFRDLLAILTSVVLSAKPGDSNGLAQNHYYNAGSLIPILEKYLPGKVAAVQQWRSSVQRTFDRNTQFHQDLNNIPLGEGMDAILALTNRYPAEFHSQIYERAAWRAMTDGDSNRARQIVHEFIKNPEHRRNLLEQIEQQSVWNRMSQNKIAEARGMLARVKNVEQRVNMLLNMAMNVSNPGDKKQAVELLDEAKALLDSQPADGNKMVIRLQLAQNYLYLNSEQSVALLEPIILKLNEMVAAAVVLDGFDHRYLKNGEWTKTNYTNLGNVINQLDQTLSQLARVDLETARRLSNLLERLEIRLVAQLEIVKGRVTFGLRGRRPISVIISRPFRINFN